MDDYASLDLVQLWQLVLGTLLPLVIAAVTRAHWSARRKSVTMLGFVAVTTTVGMLIEGRLHPTTYRDWVAAVFVVFLTTTATYRHVWRPTEVAQKVESSVNAGTAPPEPVTEAVPVNPDDQPWSGVGA